MIRKRKKQTNEEEQEMHCHSLMERISMILTEFLLKSENFKNRRKIARRTRNARNEKEVNGERKYEGNWGKGQQNCHYSANVALSDWPLVT